MTSTFTNPFQPPIELKRYPARKNETLQAWDSADEILLTHLKELELMGKRILIVGDSFGALSYSLRDFSITTYTDSYVSAKGIRGNAGDGFDLLHNLKDLAGIYDYVLIKIPKSLSYFEDILAHLTQHLSSKSEVICASMVKYLVNGNFDLLEKYIGKTKTSLAQKKARLVFATFEKAKVDSPFPLQVQIDSFEKPFIHHSNVFSREKLDIGTRFFLEHIPRGNFATILDLGCGNGVVGVEAKRKNPNARIIFTDDSAMAVESARRNYENYFSDEAEFVWTNCYEDGAPDSLDLVLCNPPFHQQNTIGNHIAWQMFTDAHKALRKGGRIWIIGNSHLMYLPMLKRVFGNSKSVAKNTKFTILNAIK